MRRHPLTPLLPQYSLRLMCPWFLLINVSECEKRRGEEKKRRRDEEEKRRRGGEEEKRRRGEEKKRRRRKENTNLTCVIAAVNKTFTCQMEKCGKTYRMVSKYKDHIFMHTNPEAYRVAREARKEMGSKKVVALYCGFPGCEKGKDGRKEVVYTSTSGYSAHVKSHIDPGTNKPWIPPRVRVTDLTRINQYPVSQFRHAQRVRRIDKYKRGLQRKIRERTGVNIGGGLLVIPGGKLLRDATMFPEMFPENCVSSYSLLLFFSFAIFFFLFFLFSLFSLLFITYHFWQARQDPSKMIHCIHSHEEFLGHFSSWASGKVYPIQYGRVIRRAWVTFPLFIVYDLETGYVNIKGTYNVEEITKKEYLNSK